VSETLAQRWHRLPAIVRAIALAWAILFVGQLPPGLFLYAGVKLTPAVPWFVLATPLWLWALWNYLSGRWWPRATAAARARTLEAPFSLRPYPWWTQLAFFLTVAVTAGVVEEAAFRGYMLSTIEHRHGWVAGILIVSLAFYAAHLGHAYATIAFLPFFMAYSLVQGILVYFTRSIVPSVVLHSIGDFIILPIQYGVVADPLGSSVGLHALVIVVFATGGGLAFWRLATIARMSSKTNSSPLGGNIAV
jgi:membrane protease YdiL (CAAX protease family)